MDSNPQLDKKKLKLDEEQVKQELKDATIGGDDDVKTKMDNSDDVKDKPIERPRYYDSSDEEMEEDVDDDRYKEYRKIIRESEGFHIPDKPQGIRVQCPRVAIIKDLKFLEQFARAALIWYMENKNDEDKEKYELVRAVRGNGRPASGIVLYITFIGRAVGANFDVQFRAIVLDGINDIVEVESCEIDPLGR